MLPDWLYFCQPRWKTKAYVIDVLDNDKEESIRNVRLAIKAAKTVLKEIAARKTKDSLIERMELDGKLAHTHPSLSRAVFITFLFLLLWFVPILLIFIFTEKGNIFVQQSLFFSKLAVVTFRGDYAV